MVVELRTLRITSEFNADSYAQGMQKKVSADQAGAASSKAVGDAIDHLKLKANESLSALEKLAVKNVAGAKEAYNFNREMRTLAQAQGTANASASLLEATYEGMTRRFGLQADATELAARGYVRLATAIETVNTRLAAQRSAQAALNDHVPARAPTPSLTGGVANDNMAQFRRQNLGYQIFDIGQTAAMGMNPMMIFAQQGPQIIQMYAGNGGVNAALKDFGAIVAGATKYLAPFAAAGAAAYGVYKLLASNTVEASLAVDDLTKALAGQAAPLGSLRGQIDELTGFQKTYNEAIRESAKVSTEATATIIANTEREFNARKALLELEEKRQQALLKSQQSELLIAQQQLKRQLAEQVTTRTDYQAQGYADPRIGSVPFVRLPDSLSGLDKTRDILENSPLTDRIKELRANMELTEIGAQQLQEALKKTFNTTPYGEGTLPIVGPVPVKRPNIEMEGLPGEAKTNEATRRSYGEIVRSAQERIEQMKLEAQVSGLTGIAAERMRFQLDMLQEAQEKGRKITPDQRSEIEKLGDAYEEAARQAARLNLQADAQFDGEQLGRSDRDQKIASQLRGAGLPVDMKSYEAGILRANEALRDQIKTWADIRDIGRDAIDQITGSALNGFDDINDVLKNVGQSIVKEFAQLSIANPLKNAVYGDNNPTMESVGGIGGVFSALLGGRSPALTGISTQGMCITAASVSISFDKGEGE